MAPSVSDIYRIIYRSRPTPAVAKNIEAEVDTILETSIYWNYSVGLTGLLLYAKDYFIQAIEGPQIEVLNVFSKISLDRRHCDLSAIFQGGVDKRLFSDWAMCAASLSSSDSVIVDRLENRADFRPEALTAQAAERLLVAVADIQRRSKGVVHI